MSALDFGARALALRGAELSPRTFAKLQTVQLGSSLDRVESTGHLVEGLGAAAYVCDQTANAALLAAHPRAVFAGANGRYFRLLGTADGFVTPEMMGCPAYTAGVNQRPYIQAAVDYAKAVGLKGVAFVQETYELWAPVRTGAFTADTDHTGTFIVIDGFACSLIGKHGHRTTLDCKGPNGGNLLTDYQVLNSANYGGDVIWRGHAVKLTGSASAWATRPADRTLSHVTIRDLVLRTDMVGVRNNAWPAYPASRDATRVNCWDTSNKGIYCQQDRHIGDLTIENVDIIGFLGEALYAPAYGANGNCKVVVRNVVVKHTNGQALNPNGMASMDVDGFYAENCSVGIEGWFGNTFGRLVNAHFKDCNQTQLSGGAGPSTPLRSDSSQPVLGVGNVIFENCGDIYVGSYVQGSISAIDTRVALVPLGPTALVHNTNLRITSVVHKASPTTAIRYAGYPGVSQVICNTQIHLHAYRSKYAIENGFQFNALWSQSGSLGPKNYLYARGEGFGQVGTVTTVTDNYVALIDEGLDLTVSGAPSYFDPSATPAPDMATGVLRGATFAAGNGVYPVTLPATTMYPHNAEIVIEHRDTAKPAGFMEILDAGTRRALVGLRDRVKLRCNRLHSRWDVITAPALRSATASIDVTSTALGAESGPYIVALPGCRPYYNAQVSAAALMPGFVISAIRPEDDKVKFWVRNIDGANPTDPAAQVFTATLLTA